MRATRLLLVAVTAVLASACQDDPSRLAVVGSIERTLVELVAPASETIDDIAVRRGQHLQQGTVVAHLNTTVAHAEVARSVAAVVAARSAEAVAAQDVARVRDLRRKRIAPPQDLERAVLAREEATARRDEAEAAQAVAEKRLADLTIKAPVAGTVDQIPFDPGERVPVGAVLAVIERDDAPWVRTWIPERAIARLPPGSIASVRVDDGRPDLRGCLEHVSREPEFTPHYALTERERAYLVYEARIELGPDAASLRSGIPTTVIFDLDHPYGPDGARSERCRP